MNARRMWLSSSMPLRTSNQLGSSTAPGNPVNDPMEQTRRRSEISTAGCVWHRAAGEDVLEEAKQSNRAYLGGAFWSSAFELKENSQ